jgi:DNA transposition AAA+ family ATPase
MNDLSFQQRLDFGQRPPPGPAQLTNMNLALRTYLDCAEAGAGLPRIGLLYGPSGYGKTVAMGFTAQRADAAYLEAKSIWTQRSLLEAIAEEIGIRSLARSGPLILGQIIDQLNREPRGLIFDEMDHLVRKQHVEIIRDIHDATTVPILLVGEEALPSKLKAWERFHNRILVATAAQPATEDDARKLHGHYCPRVAMNDDLIREIVRVCRRVTRRIVVCLKDAERCAAEQGVDAINLAWWGARPFATGDVPVRRLAA